MSQAPYIQKGSRVVARWFQSKPFGTFSLSGMQIKTTGHFVQVTGVCRHFRGDDPVNPTFVDVYLDIDGDLPAGVEKVQAPGCSCEGGHVKVKSDWIKGVL